MQTDIEQINGNNTLFIKALNAANKCLNIFSDCPTCKNDKYMSKIFLINGLSPSLYNSCSFKCKEYRPRTSKAISPTSVAILASNKAL